MNSVASNLSCPTTPVSPSNPRFYYQTSPPPTGQVLSDVVANLRPIEAIQNIIPNWKPLEDEEVQEEEVVQGFIQEEVDNTVQADNMPDAVDFEDENGQDEATAVQNTRTLVMEFNTDVEFWFIQLENEMYQCGVKSQWLKRCVLVKNLPAKIQADVKSLLLIKQSAAPPDLYKQIKEEILRIHAPAKEDNFKKALSRVLVGLPSQLGEILINDICTKTPKLTGCCCDKAVYTLWCLQLPLHVKGHVATMDFNGATYKEVFKSADKIFLSSKTPDISAGVAAVSVTASQANPDQAAQVAATTAKPPKKNKNKNNKGSGGSGGGGGNGSQGQGNKNQNSRGRRHSSGPPSSCCDNHYRWGADSWFCLEPHSCPWKDKCKPRPAKQD